MVNKNISKNRLRVFQLSIILVLLIFILFLILPKSYTKKYEKDGIEIVEEYNKKEKRYYFTFKYNDIILDYLIDTKYQQDRKLISKIEIKKDENDNFCLIPESKKIDFKPLCYDNKEVKEYTLINNELKDSISKYIGKENKKIETYKDVDIYNNDYTYLLWNYDGFYYITKNTKKKIDILSKELYTINQLGYTKDYLVIPDYDSEYTFNHYYTIDFKKGNLKKHELDRKVYFDSYFIGYEKNKIYIVDNKESLMYEFDAKKGKIDKMRSEVIKDGKWESVNIKTLINKKEEFSYKTHYNYELKDNKIYLNYTNSDIKKLVSEDVTSIVRIKDKDIYYLKKDTLYHFNEQTGEEKLLTYFEWNFNYNNMIYIN